MSMRLRQKTQPHIYPRWSNTQQSPARLCKERDGKHCVDCGVEDRALALNANGEAYFLYLHAAHIHALDPDPVKPIDGQRLRARCPRCHRLYDMHWRARQQEVDHQCRLHGILRTRFFENRFLRVL